MPDKVLPQIQGVASIDNLIHLWNRPNTDQFIAICDAELMDDTVAKGKKGDLCPVCVDLGMKVPKG